MTHNGLKWGLLFSLAAAVLHAGQPDRYFYKGLPYGSQSLVNPVTMILHGGYGILAMENRPHKPLDLPYEAGWENL
ncbi:MAG TPA: hypothetical protein PLG50_17120, partial [bacterium]|nr:hypothetical protein [bacterium]